MDYIQYKNTNYVILKDGRVARLLKPTKIRNQQYINFIINGKQERINTSAVKEMFLSQVEEANAESRIDSK